MTTILKRWPCEDTEAQGRYFIRKAEIRTNAAAKSRNAKDFQQPPQARRRQGRILQFQREHAPPGQPHDFGVLVSRTIK